jgi:hypothetical protein
MRFPPNLLFAVLLAACTGNTISTEEIVQYDVTLPEITFSAPKQVVPAAKGFPSQVTPDHSNNNLDIIDFEGRLYFAFRTGPDHFATDKTRMYIVSTKDEVTWDYETTIQLGTDAREPRFFAWQGKLYLYFASLGMNPLSFEPGEMLYTERNGPGDWSAPKATFEKGFIPWRIKIFDGKPIMIGYTGGEHIYDMSHEPLHIYLLTTTNGTDWTPLNPARPFVLEGGGSETDIEFDDAGNLWAVVRNEAGDEMGFGSKVCFAPQSDITAWQCKADPKKYDSPLLLKHGSEIYLIGRRNVTETGAYDLGIEGGYATQYLAYQADYWERPKRCALWHLDRSNWKVDFLLDFPSRGDTCFPSALPRDGGSYLLYNYSSPIDGPDLGWHDGQLGDTHIYSLLIRFAE